MSGDIKAINARVDSTNERIDSKNERIDSIKHIILFYIFAKLPHYFIYIIVYKYLNKGFIGLQSHV